MIEAIDDNLNTKCVQNNEYNDCLNDCLTRRDSPFNCDKRHDLYKNIAIMSAFNANNNINRSDFCETKRNLTQLSCDSDNKQLSSALPVICGDVTADNITIASNSAISDLNIPQRKMPVSQLQEFCSKRGLQTPEYRLVRTEGQSHSPLFTIQVVINGLVVCEGIAKNKKLAKHSAADKAFNELNARPELVANVCKEQVCSDFNKLKISSDKCDSAIDSISQNDLQTKCETNNSRVNAVSVLQEICAKSGISLPIYEQLNQLGPSHDPIFWISCKIITEEEDIYAKGSGKSKQTAKRNAAEEALKILHQKEFKFASITKKNKSKGNNLPNNTNFDLQTDGKEMLAFLESIYDIHQLDGLFDANDNEYCLKLNIIAEKLGLIAEYMKFTAEQSKSHEFKCLLQLQTNNSISRRLPLFVSWGNSSVSTEHAMQKAAQKALIMIKVLKM